ncbi:MAG: hypothetical protein Alpg2KO_27240 [Alphaproteobacteria bacterium]
MASNLGLIADIGGTNARFALVGRRGIRQAQVLKCGDHPSLVAAARAYLADVKPDRRITHGAFCVAAAVTGDMVQMTNHPWSFSIQETEMRLGLSALKVINDFTAVALSIPQLEDGHRRLIGGTAPQPHAPIGVIGPGSGLGVSALVRCGDHWEALATEGGHVTIPAVTDREEAVIAVLREQFGHVSAERVISGQGLENLYAAIRHLNGDVAQESMTAARISDAALAETDQAATEALQMMCAMLGTVSGNLALSIGARGGMYIAGGILPKLGDTLDQSQFRSRFVSKGRFDGWLDPIPTWLITHELPAFLGLKGLLADAIDLLPASQDEFSA